MATGCGCAKKQQTTFPQKLDIALLDSIFCYSSTALVGHIFVVVLRRLLDMFVAALRRLFDIFLVFVFGLVFKFPPNLMRCQKNIIKFYMCCARIMSINL